MYKPGMALGEWHHVLTGMVERWLLWMPMVHICVVRVWP